MNNEDLGFLYKVASKSDMHKLIDDLKDTDFAILISNHLDTEVSGRFELRFRTLGPATMAQVNYVLDQVKFWSIAEGSH